MSSNLDHLTQLPSLPTVAVEVLKALNHPETAVLQLVELIQADPALAAKTLEAANSARFNSRGVAITRLERAVLLLGKRVVCSLALNISFAQATLTHGPLAREFRAYWLESFVRAVTARWVAQRIGLDRAEEAYTLGLMSLIGRLVLLKHAPDDFVACLAESRRRSVPVEVIERERCDVTSLDLTISLLERWKFEPVIVDAVRLASEADQGARRTEDVQILGRVLRSASILGRMATVAGRRNALEHLNRELQTLPFYTPDLPAALVSSVLNQLYESAALFNIERSQIEPFEELLAEADSGEGLEVQPQQNAVRTRNEEEFPGMLRAVADGTAQLTLSQRLSCVQSGEFDAAPRPC